MHRLLVFLLLCSTQAMGQIETIINFNGQNGDTVRIDQAISVIRQVPVQVPSTCTRQIPYEAHECNNVTRHRQECHWEPARRDCWTENDQVCRPVTRSREECQNGPGRQVCTERPRREVCTDRPSRQECTPVTRHREECSSGSSREVCTDRPSREVCVERPTREVCRTKPDGTEHCTTVGGGQSCQTVGGGRDCRTVPGERTCRNVAYTEQQCRTVGGGQDCTMVGGGQSCHDVPGERSCRNVSYTEQECHNVPRQQCRDVAGHNACRDIPYTEQVCGNVTRYHDEQYACTRTENQSKTFVKQLKGDIKVQFQTNGLVEAFLLAVVLSPKSAEQKEFEVKSSLKKEPKVLVVAKKHSVKSTETEKEINLEGVVVIEVLESKMVSPSFPQELAEVSLNAASKVLSMKINGEISGMGEVELSITRRGWFGRRSTIVEFKDKYPSKKIQIKGQHLLVDLKGVLADGVALSKLTLDLKLTAPLTVPGVLLNAVKPKTEAEYGGLWVEVE